MPVVPISIRFISDLYRPESDTIPNVLECFSDCSSLEKGSSDVVRAEVDAPDDLCVRGEVRSELVEAFTGCDVGGLWIRSSGGRRWENSLFNLALAVREGYRFRKENGTRTSTSKPKFVWSCKPEYQLAFNDDEKTTYLRVCADTKVRRLARPLLKVAQRRQQELVRRVLSSPVRPTICAMLSFSQGGSCTTIHAPCSMESENRAGSRLTASEGAAEGTLTNTVVDVAKTETEVNTRM